MKNEIIKKSFIKMKTIIMAGFLILALSACNQKPEAAKENENQEENTEGGLTSVVLTAQQFNALGMKVDTLSKRNFSSVVVANGQLEVCLLYTSPSPRD